MRKAVELVRILIIAVLSLLLLFPSFGLAAYSIDWSLFDFEAMASDDFTKPPFMPVPSDMKSLDVCIMLTYQIETEAGTDYEWTSSNESVAYVYTTGRVHAVGPGKAIVTGKDRNSVGHDIQIQFNVPEFYLSDTDITLNPSDSAYFIAQANGGTSMISMKTIGDSFSVESVDTGMGPYPRIYRIVPLNPGKGTIRFDLNGKSSNSISVTVK